MVTRRLVCPRCKHPFTRPKGTNRLYCTDCKPRREVNPRTISADPEPAPPAEPPVERGPGPIELAARAELESFGRLTSVKGQIALRLARVLDDPSLPEARLSTMSAQLERTLDSAVAGATPPADRGDEMAEARRRKRESA